MRTLLVTAFAALGLFGSGCGKAEAFESFTLERQDQLIAEAPGCEAECVVVGGSRVCSVKDASCRVVCRTLPECRTDGDGALKVCAIVPGRR